MERKREKAKEMLDKEFTTYGAFEGERVIGELMLIPTLDHGRLIIDSFHVSGDLRRQGIGRKLFETAKDLAREKKATGLYVSACSAQETIDFYKAMGFVVSSDPIPFYAQEEPFDIQMECYLD